MRTISRMQNCRTQRIPSEGEAERGRRRLDGRAGPQNTYQWLGCRAGRGADVAARPRRLPVPQETSTTFDDLQDKTRWEFYRRKEPASQKNSLNCHTPLLSLHLEAF
ncbi:hypothetical protein MRX96_055517 [Rhipicephalus microplus]